MRVGPRGRCVESFRHSVVGEEVPAENCARNHNHNNRANPKLLSHRRDTYNMWFWPNLKLTKFEKLTNRLYKEDGYPGVLRRVYTVQLASVAQPENNIPIATNIGRYQVARRTRVWGITFSGNTDQWRIKVSNTNGTLYTIPSQRSQQFPVVSSLVAGSFYNALSTGGMNPLMYQAETDSVGANGDFSSSFLSTMQSFPWLIEPNWVCQPNETIIFEGTSIAPTWTIDGDEPFTGVLRTVLNISVYAWEFPGMSV